MDTVRIHGFANTGFDNAICITKGRREIIYRERGEEEEEEEEEEGERNKKYTDKRRIDILRN